MLARPHTLRPTAFLFAAAAVCSLTAPAAAQSTTRVSVDSWGREGSHESYRPSISSDGRYVAFESDSSLTTGGPMLRRIYLHDRHTGETSKVSVNSQGEPATAPCSEAAVSSDGRFVAFCSSAMNLSGRANNEAQLYLHDRQTGVTTRLSVNSSGDYADQGCYDPEISADGLTVVFQSYATNLVPNDTNHRYDIFVCDLPTGAISLVSVDSAGVQANGSSELPSISADGRHVAFVSSATNLVSGDTNDRSDVFVHDRMTGRTTRASVRSTGAQNPQSSIATDISGNGRFVAFQSDDEVFVHDRQTGQTTLESKNPSGVPANGRSSRPTISASGRYLAFASYATDLVPGDANGTQDCFMRDRQTGEIVLLSASTAGIQGNSLSDAPMIAAEAGTVVFSSRSTNLVAGDNNLREDLFAFDHERRPHLTRVGWSAEMVELQITDATPFGQVAVLYGLLGEFTRLATPCAGVTVNLASPHLATLLTADASGAAAYSFFAPAQSSGLAVQVVDLGNCMASGTAALVPREFQLTRGGAPCLSGLGVSVGVSEATPLSPVALLYGAAGSYVKPAGTCAGLTISLAAPTVLVILTTNSVGVAGHQFFPPPALCSLAVQGVELRACVVSNTVTL